MKYLSIPDVLFFTNKSFILVSCGFKVNWAFRNIIDLTTLTVDERKTEATGQ